MPLIKTGGYVEPELFDYRCATEWLREDRIRTLSHGQFVSARAASLRSSVVIKSLEQMAEPGVIVNQEEIMNLYRSSQMAIGLEMSKLFFKVSKVAINPQKSPETIPVDWLREGRQRITTKCEVAQLAFFPVAADYLSEINVVLFRVVSLEELQDDPLSKTFNQINTGVVGLCTDTISVVSRELRDYVAAIEARAVAMEAPTQILNALNARLRPEETRAREFKDKQAAYGSHFGTWG